MGVREGWKLPHHECRKQLHCAGAGAVTIMLCSLAAYQLLQGNSPVPIPSPQDRSSAPFHCVQFLLEPPSTHHLPDEFLHFTQTPAGPLLRPTSSTPPATMSLLRPLRGGCHCGRNRYIIDVPENETELAQVIFNTDSLHRKLSLGISTYTSPCFALLCLLCFVQPSTCENAEQTKVIASRHC